MKLVSAFDEGLRPYVRLELKGPLNEVDAAALLDTGFDGVLKLDAALADHLGVEALFADAVEFADGSIHQIPMGRVAMMRESQWVTTEAYFAPGGTLVGLKFLRGHLVSLEVTEDGQIRIEPLAGEESDKL